MKWKNVLWKIKVVHLNIKLLIWTLKTEIHEKLIKNNFKEYKKIIEDMDIGKITIVGGENSITDNVMDDMEDML